MDMLWGLIELGIDADCFSQTMPVCDYSEEQLSLLCDSCKQADIALSQRFSVVIAEACHRTGCIYISWIWDSPQRELYLEEAKYDTNRIFVFDRCQLKRMQEFGIGNIYYEPLATNVTRTSTIVIDEAELARYGHDVSFVGSMKYNENRRESVRRLGELTGGASERLLQDKIGHWGRNDRFYDRAPEDVLRIAGGMIRRTERADRCIPESYLTETMLADEISYLDRVEMINAVAGKYDLALFTELNETGNDLSDRVKVFPRVSYDQEMPKIFNVSGINLNLTKISIESGVPLRVFDILGVGGFALTDEKEELYEIFDVGKELDVYTCVEELKDKIGYYLQHETIRKQIAYNGYCRVRENYTYPKAVERMLQKA